MKNTICYIETEKSTYPMVFNLNVMEEIQDKYGSMEKWSEAVQGHGEPNVRGLKDGIMIMVNEAIDIHNEETPDDKIPFVTGKQIGRIISEVGIGKITDKIKEITIKSTDTGEEQKNA